MDRPSFWYFPRPRPTGRWRDIPSEVRRRPWSSSAMEAALAGARDEVLVNWMQPYCILAAFCMTPASLLALIPSFIILGSNYPFTRPTDVNTPAIVAYAIVAAVSLLVGEIWLVLRGWGHYVTLMRAPTFLGCVDRHFLIAFPIVVRWYLVAAPLVGWLPIAIIFWQGSSTMLWCLVGAATVFHFAWVVLLVRLSIASLRRAAELAAALPPTASAGTSPAT